MTKNGVIEMDVAMEEVKAAVEAHGVLSKDAFTAAAKPKLHTIPVPSLGGSIVMRSLSKGEVTKINKANTSKGETGEDVRDADGLLIDMVAACLVEPCFSREELVALYEEGTPPFWTELTDLLLRENRMGQYEGAAGAEAFRPAP